MIRNQRMTCREAIRAAQAAGIRVRKKWDGHWLFFLDGNRTVSVADGRGDDPVPPRLAVAIRRANASAPAPPAG